MSEETNIHRESRLAKLRALEESGYNPYPYRFQPTAFAADLQEKYKDLEAGTDTEDRVTVAGRAMAVRNSGMFIDIKDKSGKIQAFCHKNHLSEEELARLKNLTSAISSASAAISAARRAENCLLPPKSLTSLPSRCRRFPKSFTA